MRATPYRVFYGVWGGPRPRSKVGLRDEVRLRAPRSPEYLEASECECAVEDRGAVSSGATTSQGPLSTDQQLVV